MTMKESRQRGEETGRMMQMVLKVQIVLSRLMYEGDKDAGSCPSRKVVMDAANNCKHHLAPPGICTSTLC